MDEKVKLLAHFVIEFKSNCQHQRYSRSKMYVYDLREKFAFNPSADYTF